MAGGHFDSWIAGDGASDNGAGSVVVMEAARILGSLGVAATRTIRFALWEGEEQGLLGSRAYIEQHLVERPTPPGMDGFTAYMTWSEPLPAHQEARLCGPQSLFQHRQWIGKAPRHLFRRQCRGGANAQAVARAV